MSKKSSSRWIIASSLSLLAAACSSNSTYATRETVTLVTTATTAACPNGGVAIESGIDYNDNGVLDPSEVMTTSNVCNGGPGYQTLVTTTVLPDGNANCINGGTEVDVGVDNGAGGGTAGDGILQPGEITSTRYICNGADGIAYYVGAMTPPAGPAGAYTIDTSGADSTDDGTAGSGGAVSLQIANGTLGGHVKVFNTGVVDASFSVPTPDFVPGIVPLVVAADTSLTSYANTTIGLASTDVFFQVDSDANLYKNIQNIAVPVTSIDIAQGFTLTLANNAGGTNPLLNLHDDLRNAGTLTVAATAQGVKPIQFQLTVDDYLGAVGSVIELSGADGATGDDGAPSGGIYVNFYGTFVNQGDIHAWGGNGDAGAAGGTVSIVSQSAALVNTGTIDVHGGAGAVTTGGAAGTVQLEGYYQELDNSGALIADGGDGITGAGDATYSNFYILDGTIRNSGSLSATGGACTDLACTGGAGGNFDFSSQGGGDILNSGDINTSGGAGITKGGTSLGATFSSCDCQGNDLPLGGGTHLPSGSIRVSGSITARGGSGLAGGSGGEIQMTLTDTDNPLGQEIELRGYTDMILSGGSSPHGNGGTGGEYLLQQVASANDVGGTDGFGPAGAVINYANVTSHGGDGVVAAAGGQVKMLTQAQFHFDDSFEIAANFGNLDVVGGSAPLAAGANSGGSVTLDGIVGAQNSGMITIDGGRALGTNSTGGGGNVYIKGEHGAASNFAAISCRGGDATGADGSGANAGSVYIVGSSATNSAAISCIGGAGDGADEPGGDGGFIDLFASPNGPSMNSGTLSVAGGTGTPPGVSGTIDIDGTVTGS